MSGFQHCPACGFDLQALSAVVEACLAVARYNEQSVEKIVLVKAEAGPGSPVSPPARAREKSIAQRVRDYLASWPRGECLSPAFLAGEIGASAVTVQPLLYQMMAAGELERPERGWYCRPVH